MSICGKRALELLGKISFERLGGSPEEEKAADILIEELASFGLKGVKEAFETECYEIQTATFTVLEPYQQEYTVAGYGLTGCTPEGGLTAELLYVGEGDEVDLMQAEGKIVLINSRVRLEAYERLAKAKVAGFIAISGNVFDNPADTDLDTFNIRPGYYPHGRIPGATIRAVDALDLIEKGACKVKFELAQSEGKATSHNVVAEIKGKTYPDEVIVYTAHYDSVPFSSGANDNGAGSVILMELARCFAENQPERTVRFIWCGTEEQGLVGSFAYVAQHKDEMEPIKLNINVDVAGGFIGRNVTMVVGPTALVDVVDYLCKEMGVSMTTRHDVYSSDSVPFAEMGIPSVNFCRFGAPIHNRYDLIKYISADRLAELAEVVLVFSQRTVNAKAFPVARELPEASKKAVIKYLQNSRGKKMEIPAALK